MTDKTEIKTQYYEGSPWFWKIFGGAIFGMISILLLGFIGSINNNIDRSFFDLRGEAKEMRSQLDAQKTKLAGLEQSPCKDKIANLEKTVAVLQVSLEEHKQKVAACEAQNTALKDEMRSLRDWNKELTKTVAELRERFATMNAKKTP